MQKQQATNDDHDHSYTRLLSFLVLLLLGTIKSICVLCTTIISRYHSHTYVKYTQTSVDHTTSTSTSYTINL